MLGRTTNVSRLRSQAQAPVGMFHLLLWKVFHASDEQEGNQSAILDDWFASCINNSVLWLFGDVSEGIWFFIYICMYMIPFIIWL